MKDQKIRSPRHSEVIMTELVLPQHTNALGSIFGGVVMSWIDIAAAIAASRHSGRVCVTASIDELHFLKPIRKGEVCNLHARVTSVNRSSCEVRVTVNSEDPYHQDQARKHTATAFLTFVALDDSGKPTPMPPLELETNDDKRLETEAELRRASRKQLRESIKTP